MAQLPIRGGSTFGVTRKALRAMFTELYSSWSGTSLVVAGDASIAGTVVSIPNLPTADPTVAGQLWSNAGVVTVSAG